MYSPGHGPGSATRDRHQHPDKEEVPGSSPGSPTSFSKVCPVAGAKRGASTSCGLGSLLPVDLLCHDRRLVPDEIGNGLDRHAVVTEDRHERVTQFPGSPVLPDAKPLW